MKVDANNLRMLGAASTAVLVALLSIWSIASAQDFSKRFYINGGMGITHVEPESSSDALQVSDNADAGGHLAVGFDISRILTVEAYAADLGQAEIEFLEDPVGNVGYQVYGLSALGYLLNTRSGLSWTDEDTTGLFRREGASLYGRLGLGHMTNDSTQVTYYRDYPNHAVFGLGVEYGFTNGMALRTELMAMDTDARYWNIGILKRFGQINAAPVALTALPVSANSGAQSPEVRSQSSSAAIVAPIVPPSVYFELDSAILSNEAMAKLTQFADAMRDNILQLRIEGHTDAIASESYNYDLSERRARVVESFLVGEGVLPDRMNTIGYGESRPVSTNDTEEGRSLNRRTQIQLRRK